ncbi:MAG: leucine-rich repeat domain-containing protein [Lachnospiraceae bacterium]|nr:leucine-rich repeat domain-containing protein [Lachnospiraceae bacterium]
MLYFYKESEDATLKLYRVYGEYSEVTLPERIRGKEISEIAAYCFSDRERDVEEGVWLYDDAEGKKPVFVGSTKVQIPDRYHVLAGRYLEKVTLPATVRKIGDFCFYNCTKLYELSFHKNLENVGSDVFMNCMNLHRVCIYANEREKTVLRRVLSQIKWDVEVRFETEGKVTAALLYPEYVEGYNEIGPAHIFGLNITGEGVRARQCFADERVAFAEYDRIFEKACAEESNSVLWHMAFLRLYFPIELNEADAKAYADFLLKNESTGLSLLWKKRKHYLYRLPLHKKLAITKWMIREGYFTRETLEELIRYAGEKQWAEVAARCIEWRQTYLEDKDVKAGRYDFEEF